MPIFLTNNNKAKQLGKDSFLKERDLQSFVETNMKTLFGIDFLATEYRILPHNGRIDSLGIDENDSPIIIEYKKDKKDNVINQGLFYLDWLIDHQADFKLLVQEKLDRKPTEIKLSPPRVLLIARSFNKYDLYAVKQMSNIELWEYSRYEKNVFELKLVGSSQNDKTMQTKGKPEKATQTKGKPRKISQTKNKPVKTIQEYDVEHHFKNSSDEIRELFDNLREKILDFGSENEVKEVIRKIQIVYRMNKNFATLHIQKKLIRIYLRLPKDKMKNLGNIPIGEVPKSHGWSDKSSVVLKNENQLDDIVDLIEQCYQADK